ncbi:TIGR03086 family metal-binding protein [Streptomyces sp. NBC_00237]|uniref:TIGR03086 family metal-binding protein n=1 Tax=Streptomyces sp. NBC_00237 TaxID=2975687 RepID=UPI00224E1474|nr:TIGR03086 family metal-binding protein [Streptomyces sp. NBC_00237]MCX5205304.1 TIGR03086 family metal-binding protein [Streptomyces sp. NBC_00237]
MTEHENAQQPASAADPRETLWKAVALAGQTLAAVRPDQFDAPTPCDDYTVGKLSRHLLAVLRRITLAGNGGDVMSVPPVVEDIADDGVAKVWEEAVREARAAWADPAILGRSLTLPFGTLPGAAALVVWSGEFTVHTWDLATATGQHPAWDPEVVALSAKAIQRGLPAEPRGGPVPFGPVVEVPADAPDIEKLVAWTGRKP